MILNQKVLQILAKTEIKRAKGGCKYRKETSKPRKVCLENSKLIIWRKIK